MDATAKLLEEANYRKVYLSDLKTVMKIYQDTRTADRSALLSPVTEELTEHFGLPLAIAEYCNDVIGFASGKLNESEELEIAFYYKKGIGHSEIQPHLEKCSRNTFNNTFGNNMEGNAYEMGHPLN